MANKKGQEFSITTLVVIVLAVVVLVVLILGFSTGWSNLWSKVTGYTSPVNVDSIKQACEYACTTEASYDYCCRVRDVRYEAKGTVQKQTCNDPTLEIGCGAIPCEGVCNKDIICSGDILPVGTKTYAYESLLEKDCKNQGELLRTVESSRVLVSHGVAIEAGKVCCKVQKT